MNLNCNIIVYVEYTTNVWYDFYLSYKDLYVHINDMVFYIKIFQAFGSLFNMI
jgi:hypothetical protein